MLKSEKISARQSEIRQGLMQLTTKTDMSEQDEQEYANLEVEYKQNEMKYRAALLMEADARERAASAVKDAPRPESREWADLTTGYEVRAAFAALDGGPEPDGRTGEIVAEMRRNAAVEYVGMPIPWSVLAGREPAMQRRAGESVSTGVYEPTVMMPPLARLFAPTVAARMGTTVRSIDRGIVEYPVTTAGATATWAAEGSTVGAAAAYTTTQKTLKPNRTLGCQMRITRNTLKQSGAEIEGAIRADMTLAMRDQMDKVVFLGKPSGQEPQGVITGTTPYGIDSKAANAVPTYALFRDEMVEFLKDNATEDLGAVNLMIRPEVFVKFDDAFVTGTAVTQWDRLTAKTNRVVITSNALMNPTGTPAATSALMTVSTEGQPPIIAGIWGGIDMITDNLSEANAGILKLTALATMDVTVPRAAQVRVITGIR